MPQRAKSCRTEAAITPGSTWGEAGQYSVPLTAQNRLAALVSETVLSALPSFWPRYHEWGEVDVAVHPGMADVGMRGFSGSADVCALVAAQLERIVELTGAQAAGATHTSCACKGDSHCEYRLSWTPA